MEVMIKAIEEGLAERKIDKESEREKEVAAEEEAADRKKFEMADADEEDKDTRKDAPKGGKPTATRPRKTSTGGPRKKNV